MSCEQCHEREAVIHLTQIVNEQVTTLHLCERCAADKGVESPGSQPKTPLGTFLAAMGQELPNQVPAPRTGDNCPRCGGSLQDFRESGRLGCPDCYRSFEVPLRDLLRRLHGSTQHMGERYADKEKAGPVGPAGPARPQAAELREQLRLAVETENFELAAELRDRLRVLE
ncbi:MAG TPA: UvrB/UvrC motif-containing protein [Gemmatimonadales bacterium]|jgi:protein arginine kinase activator|nr:UvrB/UvrC motif-containing protein [Gemmatimonadales bacterium]